MVELYPSPDCSTEVPPVHLLQLKSNAELPIGVWTDETQAAEMLAPDGSFETAQ